MPGSRVRVPPFPPLCKLLIYRRFSHIAFRCVENRIDALDVISAEFEDVASTIKLLGLCSDPSLGVTARGNSDGGLQSQIKVRDSGPHYTRVHSLCGRMSVA
jgi:hypothetical protein